MLLGFFFLIFTFIIKNKIHNINNNNHNNDFEFFNIINEELLNNSNEKLNKGIWNICEKYKANDLFLNDNYKQEGTINQLFNKFNNNNNFCFKYIANEGCSLFTPAKSTKHFLNAVINFYDNYTKNFTIEQLIYFNLKNDIYISTNCGYNKEEKIINDNLRNYFKTIIQAFPPKFIFISFELSIIKKDNEKLFEDINTIENLKELNNY